MPEVLRVFKRALRQGSWPLLQRYLVAPRVFDMPPRDVDPKGSHEFHFVAGRRHEIMLHWAVRALLHHHGETVSIFVHSDGSITPRMKERIFSCFPGSVVIGDAEADHVANQRLADLPLLRELRRSERLGWAGIKAIDPFLWGVSEEVYFMDTDVIVIDAITELLNTNSDAVWSRDTWWSLDLSHDEMAARYCKGPIPQLNTGIGKLRRERFEPQRLERYLREQKSIKNDQTLLALLSSDGPWTLLDENQYMTASEPGVRGVKAKHYTTPFRALYWEEGIPVAARTLGMPLARWLSLRP